MTTRGRLAPFIVTLATLFALTTKGKVSGTGGGLLGGGTPNNHLLFTNL